MRLVAALFALTLLSGCAAGAIEEEARVLSGTFTLQHGGPVTVAAVVSGPEGPVVLAQRPLGGGRVYLELPHVLAPELLVPLASYPACSDLEVTPPSLMGVVLSSLQLLENGMTLGAIAQASSGAALFPWPQAQGDYRVFRWYAAQAGRIEGRCPGDATQEWALQLNKGWNVVLETVVSLSDATWTRRYTVAPGAFTAPWFLQDALLPPTP